MALKDILTINKLKRLFKNYARNSDRIAMVFRGDVDFNNPEIFKYYIDYLERKNSFTISDYENLINGRGVSPNILLENSTIEKLLSEYVLTKINGGYISINEAKSILVLLDNSETLSKIITAKVDDIQALGMEMIKKNFIIQDFEKIIELYKKLGFKVEFDLEKDSEFLFNETNQLYLMEKNLLTPELVSQMYQYKYVKLKEYVKSDDRYKIVPNLPILPQLIPLENDEMAAYWRRQTEHLGFDALAYVMENVKYSEDYNTFAEEDIEEFIARRLQPYNTRESVQDGILFTKNGIPTNNLFSSSVNSEPMRKILYAFWEDRDYNRDYDSKMMRYFLENIDKIQYPTLVGILKTWDKISELTKEKYPNEENIDKLIKENQLMFMKFATGGHNIQAGMFDNNGITEEFFNVIIRNPQAYALLPIVDNNWENRYTAKQRHYMNFLAEVPNARVIFGNIQGKYRHNEIEYFDDNGLNSDFYKGLLTLHPSSFGILEKYSDRLEQFYTPKELMYINLATTSNYLFNVFARSGDVVSAIEDYIDDNGLTNKFYKNMLNFSDLFSKLHEIDNNWEQHYDKNEKMYINLLIKFPGLKSSFSSTIELIFKHDFDENGIKPHVLQSAYKALEWDALIEIGKIQGLTVFTEFELKTLQEYTKITDITLKNMFKNFIINNKDNISIDKLEMVSSLLTRIEYSNATEIANFKESLASQLINLDNPLVALEKIEEIFLKNNLPVVGKIYSVFEILHPKASGFNYETSNISPVLKKVGIHERQATIFADLLKVTLGSNNRSMREYLESIEIGNEIFQNINSGAFTLEQLEPSQLQLFSIYLEHLNALYNKTLAGKLQGEPSKLTGNLEVDMQNLIKLFSEAGELDYNMPDRIIKMFGFMAGITTFEEAKRYFIERPLMADKRNREKAEKGFSLDFGDFIKGINELKYLPNILQNGSVAKEFLGDSAGSDATPLDTDLSQIQTMSGTIAERLNATAASNYGNIWLILKNDGRFYTTRTESGALEDVDPRKHRDQLEVFFTGAVGSGHYGIRTGFASTEIDYIMCETYDKRIGYEIAKNGFYIPVVDKEGKIVFSPKDYDEIRAQMGGLDYYSAGSFQYSESLVSEPVIELASKVLDNIIETQKKRDAINNVIAEAIRKVNLALKTSIDGDLTEGSVELIDTGSTARGTNMIGDGDFDLLMRIDRTILLNPEKMSKLREVLKEALGNAENKAETGAGDFRYKKVQIPGLEVPVDIDISFAQKTNKTTYSTEMALNERLASIQKDSPEQYALVAANIILAKKVMKEAGCYKPNRGEVPQGGLGGVGIENWILINGGSFEQAARSLLAAAEGKTFEEFRASYGVYDFGQNHLAIRDGYYPYDNFVTRNMSAEGFEKMKATLQQYLLTLEQEREMRK